MLSKLFGFDRTSRRTQQKPSRNPRGLRPHRWALQLEALETRLAPACTVSENPTVVNCDGATDTIEFRVQSDLVTDIWVNGAHRLRTSNVSWTVHGGGGDNSLVVNHLAFTSGLDYTLTDGSVRLTGSNYAIAYQSLNFLTLSTGSGNDTLNVLSTMVTTGVGETTLSAGGGNDTFHVGSGGADGTINGIRGPLRVLGGAGTNAFNLNDPGTGTAQTYSLTASTLGRSGAATIIYDSGFFGPLNLVLNAGRGGNTVNVLSTGSGTTATINAGGGNDILTVGSGGAGSTLGGILGALILNGQAGSDSLNFNDQGATAAIMYELARSSSPYVGRDGANLMNYDSVENLVVNAGSGNDSLVVLTTSAGTTTTVNAGLGNDTFHVGGISTQRLSGILGALSVNGQAGTDVVHVNDQNFTSPVSWSWTITSSTVTRSAAAPITYGTVETLVVNEGNNLDTTQINVPSTAAGTATTVNAGNGSTFIRVGSGAEPPSASTLNGILGPLTIHGRGGFDSLNLNDQSNTLARVYTITSTTMSGTGGGVAAITYSTLEDLTVRTGGDPLSTTLINVPSTAAGTRTQVNGGPVRNIFNVGSGGTIQAIQGALAVYGQGGTDDLRIDDFNNTADHTCTITATTVARTGAALITYGTFEELSVTTGSGNGPVNVQSSAAGTPVTVNARTGTVNLTGASGNLSSLEANVTVNGAGGSSELQIHDHLNSAHDTYTITSAAVTRSARVLSYNGLRRVTLHAGNGNNPINVTSTLFATPVTVNAGGGDDTFSIGSGGPPPASSTVNLIEGLPSFNGQGGRDVLNFYDHSATPLPPMAITYSLTSASPTSGSIVRLRGPAQVVVSHENLEGIAVEAARGIVHVRSTSANTPVTLNTRPFSAINVGSALTSLSDIQGPVTIGGGGDSTLNVNDQEGPTLMDYTITPTTVTRTNSASITYGGVTALTIRSGTGAHGFNVQGTAAAAPVTLIGSGLDYLAGPAGATTWALTGSNAGTLTGAGLGSAVSFTGVQNLYGGQDDDAFVFSNGASVSGYIDGGLGANTLNYAAYTTSVYVLMPLYYATDVGAYIFQIQNVVGGSGDDLLVGDDNSNLFNGGPGRDVLIGGGSNYLFLPDVLEGGDGEDLLIGGYTLYDTDATLLILIQAEWTRTDLSYEDRALNLYSGTGYAPALDNSTVFSNYAGNTLNGGADRDYFYGQQTYVPDLTDWDPVTEWFLEIF